MWKKALQLPPGELIYSNLSVLFGIYVISIFTEIRIYTGTSSAASLLVLVSSFNCSPVFTHLIPWVALFSPPKSSQLLLRTKQIKLAYWIINHETFPQLSVSPVSSYTANQMKECFPFLPRKDGNTSIYHCPCLLQRFLANQTLLCSWKFEFFPLKY